MNEWQKHVKGEESLILWIPSGSKNRIWKVNLISSRKSDQRRDQLKNFDAIRSYEYT